MGETLLLLGSCILPLPLPILEENPKTQGQDLKSRWLMKLGEKHPGFISRSESQLN